MGIELRMRLSECAFGLSHVALDSSRGDSLLPGMPPLVPPRGDECAFSHCYIAMDRSQREEVTVLVGHCCGRLQP